MERWSNNDSNSSMGVVRAFFFGERIFRGKRKQIAFNFVFSCCANLCLRKKKQCNFVCFHQKDKLFVFCWEGNALHIPICNIHCFLVAKHFMGGTRKCGGPPGILSTLENMGFDALLHYDVGMLFSLRKQLLGAGSAEWCCFGFWRD